MGILQETLGKDNYEANTSNVMSMRRASLWPLESLLRMRHRSAAHLLVLRMRSSYTRRHRWGIVRCSWFHPARITMCGTALSRQYGFGCVRRGCLRVCKSHCFRLFPDITVRGKIMKRYLEQILGIPCSSISLSFVFVQWLEMWKIRHRLLIKKNKNKCLVWA